MPERWSDSGDTRHGGAAISRCVVLSHPDAAPPNALFEAMHRRRVSVTPAHSLADAMVELARTRAGILVIAEPGQISRIGPLLAAVRRYHPLVLCWQFTSANGGQLSRFVAPSESASAVAEQMIGSEDESPPRRMPPRRRPVARETVESAQIASPSASHIVRGNGHAQEEPITGPLLTQEELDMLLGEAVAPDGGMIDERTGA